MALSAHETKHDPDPSFGAADGTGIPRVVRTGRTSHLLVDGKPYLSVGGELHNSSPSSPAYMAPIWDRLERNGVPSVIGAASWQLVEPEEGNFDFTAVDDQIEQSRARGMRLILIWFGSYKNADSAYAPTWVRRDEKTLPPRRARSRTAAQRSLQYRWPCPQRIRRGAAQGRCPGVRRFHAPSARS